MKAELRHDPFSDTWVSVAASRARRPVEARDGGECPFCPGNEHMTPPELASWPNGTGRHWRVRVVENLFPAFLPGVEVGAVGGQKDVHGGKSPRPHRAPRPCPAHPSGQSAPPGPPLAESDPQPGPYHAIPAAGAHEVIIEHPDHRVTWASMDEERLGLVLQAWQARYRHHAARREVRYIQVFRNSGPASGASLTHPHSQLVALPLVPALVQAELVRAARHSSIAGNCAYCDVVSREQRGPRLVLADRAFVAFCPFASRVPYETWVVPRRHQPDFRQAEPTELIALARMLRQLAVLQSVVPGGASFNLILHTAPCDGNPHAHYHWHLEWIPRTGTAGGFEWGTGWFINTVPPEEAARRLRSGPGAVELPGE